MRNKNNSLLFLGALALCALISSEARAWQTPAEPVQKSPTEANSQNEINPAATDESYRIGPGDLLDISVSKQPDYSRPDVRVGNNGMIQIPRDDVELRAACKTAREVADEIKERYRRYLRNPYVYVHIKDFQSQPVAVIGAVHQPGRFQLHRRIRLLELLSMVGGPSISAGGTVQIIRTAEGAMCDSPVTGEKIGTGELLIAYNLRSVLEANEGSNPYVRPGDVIRLPEAQQAYILGFVKSSEPIVLREPVTLSEAIARAGGLLPEANSEKIRISRHVPGASTKTELIANLKAINRRQQEDIVLQPNDIIDVPGPSGAKKFLGDLMKAATRYPMSIVR